LLIIIGILIIYNVMFSKFEYINSLYNSFGNVYYKIDNDIFYVAPFI